MSAFRGAFPHKGAKFSIDVDFTFRPGLKHFWKLLESLVWLVRDSPIILAFIKLYKLCRFSKWPLLLISLFLISTKIDYFSGESKQLADPDVLKRLTSSVRFVSFSQVWTSTAVVLSVKCPHKISYRRHFYLQFWDNNGVPALHTDFFLKTLHSSLRFFCCSFLFDINALQLCPGRGSGGSDPHALRACCATAWHRQVNKQ